jgi:hypothetical protein
MSRRRAVLTLIGCGVLVLTVVTTAGVGAASTRTGRSIGPGQNFIGLVNGRSGTATVTVDYGNITADPPAAGARAAGRTKTVEVTQADNDMSYTVAKGDRLVVTLTGPAVYRWTRPSSSNGPVLRRTSGRAGSTATGGFVTRSKGTADVTAVDNPRCYPKCLGPSYLFQVTVTVS